MSVPFLILFILVSNIRKPLKTPDMLCLARLSYTNLTLEFLLHNSYMFKKKRLLVLISFEVKILSPSGTYGTIDTYDEYRSDVMPALRT